MSSHYEGSPYVDKAETPSVRTSTCENCRHYKSGEDGSGECRRNPPVVVDAIVRLVLENVEDADFGSAVEAASQWPVVYDDSCGACEAKR